MPPRKPSGKRSRTSRPPRRPKHRRPRLRWFRLLGWTLLCTAVVGAIYGLYLDSVIRTRFEGRRWALPGRVYARALEVHPGARITPAEFTQELAALEYRPDPGLAHPGTFLHRGGVFELHTRPFEFWDGTEPGRRLRVAFADGAVSDVRDLDSGQGLGLARLDPPLIGSFYPDHREDRTLVRLADVPPLLPQALVAVEDRAFHTHFGVDPRGVVRALVANLQAGRVVQGGSTLTQQLVKNYFLSAERTLWRKANEAAMAVLLELRYDKDAILQAYLNEIYLGQQAERAIHGVGLASHFYFGRPVGELDLSRVALLVGMVRGPSLYDPRRHPERARERRDRVLDLLADRGLVSGAAAKAAQQAPLGVVPDPPAGGTPHPAFLDLVRRQLQEDYRDRDLRAAGLRIFTSLEPPIQAAAEAALGGRIRELERSGASGDGPLQGAAVVIHPATGEVLALVGGREVRYAGFNRALDARRPIGSLVKPAVFLAALESTDRYTLATVVQDTALSVPLDDGGTWTPANYDRQAHGPVTLYEALVRSHNLAAARLGMEVGVERVVDTLHRLGVHRELAPYPALLLGALELSPLEVASLYQTLANGGLYTPLRAIHSVVDASGTPLDRYPLRLLAGVEPGPLFLLDAALRGVVAEGTGSGLADVLPEGWAVAGKTGTTDDLRDSWFAGYTADWLGVVWLGLDDNRPCGLSGATGALRVWGDLYTRIGGRSLDPAPPEAVEYAWVDRLSGKRTSRNTGGAVHLPFLAGTTPAGSEPGVWQRLKRWVGGDGE